MSSEFGQFLDDLPDLNLPESKKPKRSAAYFINLHGISKDTYKDLVQLDAWLDTPEKLSQWRAIVDAVLQRVQRYEKGKHKQLAKHPWPFAREPQELNLRIDEDLEALCVIVSLWHDHYTSGYPVLTAQQKETIRKWPYRPCSYGAGVVLQWFVHLDRYLQGKGLVSDLVKVALQQPTELPHTVSGGKPIPTSGKEEPAEPKPPEANTDKGGDTPLTLRDFTKEYCEPLSSENVLERLIKALQRLTQRKQIRLNHVGQWKHGQSYKYLPSYLIENWPAYKQRLQTLPSLKSSFSSK